MQKKIFSDEFVSRTALSNAITNQDPLLSDQVRTAPKPGQNKALLQKKTNSNLDAN